MKAGKGTYHFIWLKDLLVTMLCLLATSSGLPQSANFQAHLDRDSVLIGDWITLKLEAQYPEGIVVHWPLLLDSIQQFEVLEYREADSSVQNNTVTKSQTFTIAAFDTGYFVLEPIPLAYQLPASSILDTAETEPMLVTVRGVAIDTSGIKPIKPPLDAPLTLRELLPYIGGGLVTLLLIGVLVWYFTRKKPEPVRRVRPKRPPHEIALEKLRHLEAEKRWQQGEVKKYYSEISEILRAYIEFRFDILALESVTPDILRDLQRTDVAPELQAKLKSILALSDMVKFAKFEPLPNEHKQVLERSFEWVNQTKPRVIERDEKAKPERAKA